MSKVFNCVWCISDKCFNVVYNLLKSGIAVFNMLAAGSHLTKVSLALHRASGQGWQAEDLVGVLGDDSELVGLSLSQGSHGEEGFRHIGVVTLQPAALTGQVVGLTLYDVADNRTTTVVQWRRPF